MPGRRPAPTALKLVKGNPGKRALNKREPKPKRVIPSPPDHLSPAARIAWGRFATMLDRVGVLTELDGAALEQGCEVYVEVVELRQAIEEEGRVQMVTTKSGDVMARQRPEVAMLEDADRRLRAWLVEFGMTPASRSKVQTRDDDDSTDPADKYF